MFESRYNNKGFAKSWYFQVWRIGSVLVHASQVSSFSMRWIWRICSVVWVTLQTSGFREFTVLLSLKNRLRSRACVTSFKFQNALDLKNRLRRLSHVTKIRFSGINYSFKFEESAPFSCTCHNFLRAEGKLIAKSGSGDLGRKHAPRGMTSTTFAQGFLQSFKLPKFYRPHRCCRARNFAFKHRGV